MSEPTQPSQPSQPAPPAQSAPTQSPSFANLPAEEKKTRWDLYGEHKKQTWEDIQSSTDSYDQSLLTLSSGGLGLSIAFIKDIVPLDHVVWLKLLYVSWAFFGLTILLTVASFLFSVEAQKENLEFLWQFYIEMDDSFRNKESWFSKKLRWCTVLGGTFFFAGVLCTVAFAIKNVGRYSKMADPTKSSRLMEGRNTISMTPVPQTTVVVKQDQVTVTLGSPQPSAATPPPDPGTSSAPKGKAQ